MANCKKDEELADSEICQRNRKKLDVFPDDEQVEG